MQLKNCVIVFELYPIETVAPLLNFAIKVPLFENPIVESTSRTVESIETGVVVCVFG